jgi:hypothetical protein
MDRSPYGLLCEIPSLLFVPLAHFGQREDTQGLDAREIHVVLLGDQLSLGFSQKGIAKADLGDQLGRCIKELACFAQNGIYQSL